MQTTLPQPEVDHSTAELIDALDLFTARYPDDGGGRQPVHVVYGGAHLFKADTAAKLGRLASAALDKYAPQPTEFARAIGVPDGDIEPVYPRIREKLKENQSRTCE